MKDCCLSLETDVHGKITRRMAPEEQDQRCSNTNNGGGVSFGNNNNNIGRSSKKQKQKKVPQRGLGVAQLEKIRLEEQQKKDGTTDLPSSAIAPHLPVSPPPPPPTKPSNHSVPIQNFQSYSSASSFPHSSDLSSPNSILGPQSSNIEHHVNSNGAVAFVNSLQGWHSLPVQGLGSLLPKMMTSNFDNNLGKESTSLMNFPYDANLPHIWPLPSLMQRAQQHHHQQQPQQQHHHQSYPPSAMVNVPSVSSSLSSEANFQIELPSNQSCYHHGNNNHAPLWPEEEKVVGVKRPYPFTQDNSPHPPFHYKLPAIVPSIISRSDESAASFSNGGGPFSLDPGINRNFREHSSCSNPISVQNPNKIPRENGAFTGDFLTLAPPTTNCPNSKLKCPSAYTAFCNEALDNLDSLPYQGCIEDQVPRPGSSVQNQQQHEPPNYYSFLPPTVMQTGQATRSINNCNGSGHEVGEYVDLNLKL